MYNYYRLLKFMRKKKKKKLKSYKKSSKFSVFLRKKRRLKKLRSRIKDYFLKSVHYDILSRKKSIRDSKYNRLNNFFRIREKLFKKKNK